MREIVLAARVCLLTSSGLQLMAGWMELYPCKFKKKDDKSETTKCGDFARYFHPSYGTGNLNFVSVSSYLVDLMHSSFTVHTGNYGGNIPKH